MVRENSKNGCGLRGKKRRMTIFGLAYFLLITLFAATSFAGIDMTVFGPKRYDRTKGAPNVYTDTFQRCNPSDRALLRVTNGNGKDTSITAGRISINGTVIVSENEFKQQTYLIEKPIVVAQTNELKVELKSSSRDTSFVIVEIIGQNCDSTPPVISAPTPADGALINNPQPFISAAYGDEANGSGINTGSVRLTVDGADVTGAAAVSATGIGYTPAVRLPDGVHTVSLSVADRAANAATLVWHFTTDTQAPRLTVSTLKDGSYTNNATLNVAGSAQDNVGLHDLRVNGTAVPVNADGSYSYALVLQSGANAVTVTVTDQAGNQTSDSRTITLDQTVPTISNITPADNSMTANALVSVSGSVDKICAVQVTLGDNVQTAAMTGNHFSADVTLVSGSNTIEITATDLAGNKSSVKRSVLLDDKVPELSITYPDQDISTNAGSLTIKGAASDKLTKVTVSIAVDGQTFNPPVIDGTFEQAISFTAEKKYEVAVTAANEVKTATTAQRNIIYDITPPAVAIDPVTSPTNQATQTVTGTMEAGATVAVSCATATVGAVSYPTATSWSATTSSLGQGANDIVVTAADKAGNVTTATAGIVLDTTVPVVSATPPGGLYRVPQSVTLAASEPATIYYTIDGTQPSATSAVYSQPIAIAASAVLNYFATDLAGNPSPVVSQSYVIDTVPPAVKITSPANNEYLNTPAIAVSGTLDDPTARVTVNGLPAVVTGNTFTLAGVTLTEGANSIAAVATDPAGNNGTDAIGVNLDTVAPVVTVTAPAPGFLTRSARMTVTGRVSEEFAAVTVNGIPAVVTGKDFALASTLAEGANVLNVRATDRAGNAGSAIVTGTLDTTPPGPPVFASLPSPTKTGSITLSGTAETKASVRIFAGTTLLGTVSADAQGNFALTDVTLSEGANGFTATATDEAGNESAPSIPLKVVLDTQAPQLTVSTLKDGSYTNNATLNVTGSAQDNVGLHDLRVNGTAVPVNADGSYSYAFMLQSGANAVTVTATDQAGNQTSDSRTITLDQTAPVISNVTPADNSMTADALVTVSGNVDKSCTVQVALGDNVQTAAMTDNSFSAPLTLASGNNTVEITATDLAGNKSSVKRSVLLDDKVPSLAITDPDQDIRTNAGSLTIKGTASDPLTKVTVSVSVDGQTFNPPVVDGTFEQAISLTAEKSYAVAVTAANEVKTATTAQRNIIYDITPPAVAIDPVTSPTNQASQVVTGTMEAGAKVAVTSATAVVGDVAYPTATTWRTTVGTFSADANDITVVATDAAGNTATAAARIIYDITPPTGTISVSTGATVTGAAAVQLQLSSSDADGVTSMRLSSDGVTWTDPATFTTAAPWSLGTGDGLKQLFVQYQDGAGNWSAPIETTITLDTTPPVITVATPAAGAITNSAQITVSGTVNEPVKSVSVNGAAAAVNGLSWSLPYTLAEGANTFTITAVDPAGNPATTAVSVTLDTKPPVITIAAPADNSYTNIAQASVKGSLDDATATLTINGTPVPLSGTAFDYPLTLSSGANTITLTAVDPAGNSATASVAVTLDTVPPAVTLTAPVSGLLINSPQVTVTGTVTKDGTTATLNGVPITVTNQGFSAPFTLTEGNNTLTVVATDRAGNTGSASVAVVLDTQPPQVGLTAPATAAAGANVQIGITASDNRGLTLVEVRANGVPLWSATPSGSAPLSDGFVYHIPPDLAAGSTVSLQARGYDAAGNQGTASASISVAQGASGPGFVQGKVFNDSRGLLLSGATVSVTDASGATQGATTGDDGGWFFQVASGTATVTISQDGYSTVERQLAVSSGQNSTAFDARLTPVAAGSVIGAAGGSVKAQLTPNATLELAVPAGALAGDTELHLTPVSNQGLMALLPAGWSPLAVADLRLLLPNGGGPAPSSAFTVPATLKVPVPATVTLTGSSAVILAAYDSASHGWLAADSATVSSDGTTLTAAVPAAGQYALVIADPAPDAPAAAISGAPLAAAAQPSLSFDAVATAGRVVPQAAPPAAGLKAAGEVVLTARADAQPAPVFTSGLALTALITENFNLLSGDSVQPDGYSQDIILYRTPCVTNIAAGTAGTADAPENLRTTFPVSPSRDFTIVDLLLGKVGVSIIPRATGTAGVMVGADGGRLLDADANVLVIPTGSLSQTVPVTTKTVPQATAAPLVGPDFALLRAVDVDFTRQTLSQTSVLSIPVPSGFDPTLPVIVAKRIDVKGTARFKFVASARVAGSMITSDATVPAAPLAPGITGSGSYYFLQAKSALGFVSGTVTDATANPFAGALVSTSSGSLVDLSGATGKYLLAAPVAPFTATALDLYKNDQGTATGAVAAPGQSVTLDLTIRMIPPQVVSLTPADGSGNVQPSVPVVVTFSKGMDRNSINSTTLQLSTPDGSAVPGVISFNVDGTVATLYPTSALQSETGYTAAVSAAVKDLQGYPLGQQITASFTVRKTTPPPMPAAGAVSGTFPDADGYITVTGTQGSAEVNDTVLLINDTTGEITSVTPQTDGSFTGKVRGQLGDQIKVVLMDHSGNQTTVSYLTFKGADGSYLVTAKGGTVEGDGGSKLDLPDGALVGPTIVKIAPVTQDALSQPVPNGANFLGAVNVDTGGFSFQKPVQISIPLPAGMPADAMPFLAQPQDLVNADGTVEKVYVIIDSAKVDNGRLTTACPPFDGVLTFGIFAFVYFDPSGPLGGPVTISGTTYWDKDGLPGYTPGPDRNLNDQPIQGAVIRSPGAENFIAYSNATGHYASYGFTVNGACRSFSVTAIHPQTMNRVTANLSTCDAPYIVNNFNFKLADKDTVLPDKTPPQIDLNLAVAPGQSANPRVIAGTVLVGTELQLPVFITDQLIASAGLQIGFTAPGAVSPVPIPATLTMTGSGQISTQTGILTRYTYTPGFPADVVGSQPYLFKPTQEGLYTFTVEARDASDNKSSRTISFRAIPQGSSLGSGKEGAPTIDSTMPADNSTDVMVTAPVIVWFSEPVENVSDTTFVLIDTVTGQKVPATVQAGLVEGRMQATLTPKGNLFYGRKYEIRLTNAISDSFPNADGTKMNLASFSATFATKVPKGYDLTDSTFSGRDIDLYTFTDDDGITFTYAYLTAGTQGWRIADVSDPTSPSTVFPPAGRTFPSGFDYRNLAVNQNKNLLAITENINYADGNQYGYVRFYDLAANPADPPVVGREKLAEAYSGIPGRVALMGDFAYIATINAGLQVVDIEQAKANQQSGKSSDGSSIVGVFDSVGQGYGQPNDIAAYAVGKAALTTTSGNLLTLDVSLPLPQLMAQYLDGRYHPLRVAVAPDYAYQDSFGMLEVKDVAVAGTREGRVITIDLSDPYNPATIAVTKDPAKDPETDPEHGDLITIVRELSINKDAGLAFVTTASSVQVIDIKDPANPRLLTTIESFPDPSGAVDQQGNPVLLPLGQIPAIVEKGGWAYLASQSNGLKVVDLDPGIPVITPPTIKLMTPIRGYAVPGPIPITYTVHSYGDFDPHSANMYIYEEGNVIAQFTNIKHEGTNTILFYPSALELQYDVKKHYEVAIIFDEGWLQSIANRIKPSRVRIPLEWQAIATDYNRDGKIDASDFVIAGDSAKPFYFWINDNNDLDDVTGSGIPGSTSPDWKKSTVSGTRDLIDFFPVHMDIANLLSELPTTNYTYILKQEDTAVSFVGTNLNNNQALEYLRNVAVAQTIGGNGSGGYAKYAVNRSGTKINAGFLQTLQQNGSSLLLVEGRARSDQPLVLEVWENDNKGIAFRTSLPLSLDGVEQMFRHKNMLAESGWEGPPSIYVTNTEDRLQRADFKDSQRFSDIDSGSDGTNVIYVHGYNVNDQEARGEQAEVFKRLYWSGSRARFWGITWYGWDTEMPNLPCVGKRSPNYHINVRHAYDGGLALKDFVVQKGIVNATFIAHSLGNMLVSTAIQKDMPYGRYLMLNAAVAEEAYTPEESYDFNNANNPQYPGQTNWEINTSPLMYHPLWRYPSGVDVPLSQGYQPFLWASEWYRLFTDDRKKLTWRNFFGKVRVDNDIADKTYVYFSDTDEAFLPFTYNPFVPGQQPTKNINNVPGLENLQIDCSDVAKIGTNSFALQELLKGRMWEAAVPDHRYGGWGFNKDDGYYTSCIDPVGDCGPIKPTDADTIGLNILKAKPLFNKNPDNAFLYSDGLVQISEYKLIELLANEIPAITNAAGHRGVRYFEKQNKNIDLRDKFIIEPWPRKNKGVSEWRHSDFIRVGYPYLYRLFDDWKKKIEEVSQ